MVHEFSFTDNKTAPTLVVFKLHSFLFTSESGLDGSVDLGLNYLASSGLDHLTAFYWQFGWLA